jgi:transposase
MTVSKNCFFARLIGRPKPETEKCRGFALTVLLSCKRKVLTAERVRHVNRVKGLLFSQGIRGYEPLRHGRRLRLEELQTPASVRRAGYIA